MADNHHHISARWISRRPVRMTSTARKGPTVGTTANPTPAAKASPRFTGFVVVAIMNRSLPLSTAVRGGTVSWMWLKFCKGIVSMRMPRRGTSLTRSQAGPPTAVVGVAGLLLGLLPWVGLVAPLLLAPVMALARASLSMMLAAGLLVISGLVTGGIDLVFVPLFAVGALAVGIGSIVPMLVGVRNSQAFRYGAITALAIMALVSVLDLLVAPGIVRSLLPWVSVGAPLPGRAMGWLEHPNVWAAAALPLTVLLAVWSARADRIGEFLIVVSLGAIVVLSSGSRSALFGTALGLGVVLAAWLLRANPKRTRTLILAGAALVLVTSAVLSLNSGWRQRTLALLGASSPISLSKNAFVSSEDLLDPVWWKPVVEVEAQPVARGEDKVHLLSRIEGRWSDRVQQRVRLEPGASYSLTVEFRSPNAALDDLAPAVIGWGQSNGVTSELVVVVGSLGVVRQFTSGAVNLERATTTQEDGWTQLKVGFTNRSETSIWLELGVAPRTVEESSGGTLAVRRLQLEEGSTATAYVGTQPPDRRRLQAASAVETRLRTYQAVLERAWQRPVFGWGSQAYSELQATSKAPVAGLADHEHSLPLALFFRFGIVGLAALGLALFAMGGRSPDTWAIVVAVMASNLFDLTVFSSNVYVSTPLMVGIVRGIAARAGELP